jgi:hypothetical protein
MKRPFLERVVVVLWLLCGGVAAVTAFIGAMGLYDILSQPMSKPADPWAEFRITSPAPAPATMREPLPPLPPGFVLETPGRSTGAGPMIEVQLPDGRVIEFPPDTAPDVMQRVTTQAAQQQPEPPAPQRGFGESLARVVSQIDTVTVVFLLLPSLLCIAFVSLFQYLVLGFFSPLALFRSGK